MHQQETYIKQHAFQFALIAGSLLLAALAGCGGSGGGGGTPAPVASTLPFPLLSAYQSLIASGVTNTFTVSGTCSGSGSTVTTALPSTSTPGSATTTQIMALSGGNCIPSSVQTSSASYDNNYSLLGTGGVNNSVGTFNPVSALPSTPVHVGDIGILGTETFSTGSTSPTASGTLYQSYIIEADTATTAIVNIISTTYNAANKLTLTEQDRYRIAATGALTPVSTDLQYAYTSANHLLLTYTPTAVTSSPTFDLQGAYQALVQNGMSFNYFTVSGSCNATAEITTTPATTTPVAFASVSAVSAVTTLAMTSISGAGCTTFPPTQTSTSYYGSSSYAPAGMSSANSYGEYNPPLPAIPTPVTVGSTGILGTENLYTDSGKATASGTLVLSYAVEPETSTTALVDFISKTYSTSGTLTLTEQDLYRISNTGTVPASVLTPLSMDLQYTSPYILHLLLTY